MKKKYILLLMLLLIIIISICLIYRNNNKEDTDIKVKYPIYEYYKLNKVITENINYYLKDNTDNYYFLYIDYKDYEYKEYISIVLYISYFTGGAHPNYEIKTINYNKSTNKFIDIDDLINRDKDILNKLSIYSREYFSNNDMFNDKVVFDMMIDGTKSIKDNYKYFNITSDGLIIYFNRYQIAPYYYGDYSITISYNYLNLSNHHLFLIHYHVQLKLQYLV